MGLSRFLGCFCLPQRNYRTYLLFFLILYMLMMALFVGQLQISGHDSLTVRHEGLLHTSLQSSLTTKVGSTSRDRADLPSLHFLKGYQENMKRKLRGQASSMTETSGKQYAKDKKNVSKTYSQIYNDMAPSCPNGHGNQEFVFKEVTKDVFLYSGYWDTRANDFDNRGNGTKVRLIALLRRREEKHRYGPGMRPDLSCIFYTGKDNSHVYTAPLVYYEMCENHNKYFGGFILSCSVPADIDSTPCMIDVGVGFKPTLREAITVPIYNIQNVDNKHDFGVCISPLFGDIEEDKFVEFMELSQSLGASMFTLYDAGISPNIQKVLGYYESLGVVNVVPWPLPTFIGEKVWYHGQLIAIQDCLYRNMGKTRYVAFNDIDEFIIPYNQANWHDFINATHQKNHAGYYFQSSFFDPRMGSKSGANSTLFTLKNNMGTSQISKIRTKNMVIPELVFEKGIHHVSKPIFANLELPIINPKSVLLHHYRTCSNYFNFDCGRFELSDRVRDLFGGQLTDWVGKVLHHLDIEPGKHSISRKEGRSKHAKRPSQSLR